MKYRGLVVALSFVTGTCFASPPKDEVETLLDRLVTVGGGEADGYDLLQKPGFIAPVDQPSIRFGIPKEKDWTIEPTMQKLMQLGVLALPQLLAHVDDPRPTALTQVFGHRMARVYSNQYDSRYFDPSMQPAGTVGGLRWGDEYFTGDRYQFRVGDLCYHIIGQIVNRQIGPMYCGGNYTVITSPIRDAVFAKAVRKEWSGLTAKAHEQQLEEDLYALTDRRASDTLKHLLWYYPQTGERLVVKMLSRRVYNDEAIDEVITKLAKQDKPAQWRRTVNELEREVGKDMATLLPIAIADNPRGEIEEDRSKKILKEVYPLYDPCKPTFSPWARVHEQTDLLDALEYVQSNKVDDAAHKLFLRAQKEGVPTMAWSLRYWGPAHAKDMSEGYQGWVDDLAIACAKRNLSKGANAAYHAYFQKRVQETENEANHYSEIREWLLKTGN
ncbi:MAG: hypothetical protein K8R88_01275 [Armatimonadetes bacterium]|nr:hypothetical protein [Armatimonadota bacterium]